MGVLLDTCAILWAVSEPSRLSREARASLEDEGAEFFVSAISTAEIACVWMRARPD